MTLLALFVLLAALLVFIAASFMAAIGKLNLVAVGLALFVLWHVLTKTAA